MQNVGTFDAMVRMAIGTFTLTWASSRPRWSTGETLLALTGAVILAEGATRTCLLHSIFGITTVEEANEKVLLRLGPLVYRQRKVEQRRSLWGVDTDQEDEELSYRNADTIQSREWP
jgi:hypothetical protein